MKAHTQHTSNELPAINKDEQEDLERSRYDHRWHHHHSEGHEDDGNNEVNEDKRDVQTEPHDECCLKFADHGGWDQHMHGRVSRCRNLFDIGHSRKQRDVCFSRLADHEFVQRRGPA